MFMPCTLLNHDFFSPLYSSAGTYPNRNTGVQGTNSSADSGFGSQDHASGSTAYNNMVSSVTPSQTRNFENDSTRGHGQGQGSGSTGGTGNLQLEATPSGRSFLSIHNQVRQQRVGDRMRLWIIFHKWKVIFCLGIVLHKQEAIFCLWTHFTNGRRSSAKKHVCILCFHFITASGSCQMKS